MKRAILILCMLFTLLGLAYTNQALPPSVLKVSRASDPQEQIITVTLLRLRHKASGMHFYTTNKAEMESLISSGAWVSEGIAGYCFDRPMPGTLPLIRFSKNLNGGPEHFFTISMVEAREAHDKYGYRHEGIACYVASTQMAGTVPLFRLRSDHWGHFYTTNAEERAQAQRDYGFTPEGNEGFVWAEATTLPGAAYPAPGTSPVVYDDYIDDPH